MRKTNIVKILQMMLITSILTSSIFVSGTVLINEPPNIPIISGPTYGKIDEKLNFTISSIDPDDDEVYLYILHTDGPVSPLPVEKFGPIESREEITTIYIFHFVGSPIVYAQAIDENGMESDWASLELSMTKSISNKFYILLEEKFPILFNFLFIFS